MCLCMYVFAVVHCDVPVYVYVSVYAYVSESACVSARVHASVHEYV